MPEPVRSCVGCRARAGKSVLLRLVERDGAAVPDPRQRLSGRGAYLHPSVDCLELAIRRRTLGRALRSQIDGERTAEAVRAFLTGVPGGFA